MVQSGFEPWLPSDSPKPKSFLLSNSAYIKKKKSPIAAFHEAFCFKNGTFFIYASVKEMSVHLGQLPIC